MNRLFAALAVLTVLAGCLAGLPPDASAQQRLFAFEASYDAALGTAATYAQRPLCPAVVACADPDLVIALDNANDEIQLVLPDARMVINSLNFTDAQKADKLLLLNTSLRALSAVIIQLEASR